MLKLNLVEELPGDIAYKISSFPDGQQNIDILGIYTTNSVRKIGEFEHNGMKLIKTNVKQQNIYV